MDMSEALSREKERQTRKSDASAFEPVIVKSLADIKRILLDFDPARNRLQPTLPISTIMRVQEEDNGKTKSVDYKVDAHTKSKSRRDILLEGLGIIKKRLDADAKLDVGEAVEVNGKEMKPARIGNAVDGVNWVDPIIKRWFGGERHGLLIRWQLNDGYVYYYDAYQHKLAREQT